MYLTLNAPDLVRPVYRSLVPHLSEPLERRWRLPSLRGGQDLPTPVRQSIEALEAEERRQKRLHSLSELELESVRALRTRQWNGLLALLEAKNVKGVLVWNGHRGRRGLLAAAARYANIPTVFFERSPFAGYLQANLDGVNADARGLKSDTYLSQTPEPTITKWYAASQVQRRKSRLFVSQAASPEPSLPTRFIYCPLQVAADTQIMVHGGWIKDMGAFIDAIVKASLALPADVHIVFRPHPSCRVGHRAALAKAAENARVSVVTEGSSRHLLEQAEAVVTLNSSVGLEAFAFDKPVLTLGQAFYAREGLAKSAPDAPTLFQAFQDFGLWDFNAHRRRQFLTWLKLEGLKTWPRHSRDPAAKHLASHVESLIRDEANYPS